MRDKGLPVELNDGTCVVWQVDPSAVTPKSYAQLGSATSAGDLRSAVVSAFNVDEIGYEERKAAERAADEQAAAPVDPDCVQQLLRNQ